MSSTNGHTTIHDKISDAKLRQELRKAELVATIYENSLYSDWLTGADRFKGQDQNSPPPVVPESRHKGTDRTVFLMTEPQFNILRGNSRKLLVENAYARGVIRNLTNAIIGHGGTFTCEDKNVQLFVDDCLQEWNWNSCSAGLWDDNPIRATLETQVFQRVIGDGEAPIRFIPDNGLVKLSLIDPERICNPTGYNIDDGWMFGVKHQTEPIEDVSIVEAYNVRFDSTDTLLAADELLHVLHPSTPSTVKRSIPDFSYDVRDALIGANKAQRAISLGVQVRAKIALIWRWVFNEDGPEVGTIVDQVVVRRLTQRNETFDTTITPPGTTLNIPEGTEPVAGPVDYSAQYREGMKGDLEMVAAAFSMPLFMVSGDASNANYASTKESGSPFVRMAESYQAYMAQVSLRVIYRALREALNEDIFTEDQIYKAKCNYEYPEVSTVDPLKDAQATATLKDKGIIDEEEARTQAGYDPKEST